MLLFASLATAAPCRLATIASEDGALATPLSTSTGPLPLPVGSIVRAGGRTCNDGVGVEVLGVDPTLPVATTVEVGAVGCVAGTALQGVGGRMVTIVREAAGVRAGVGWDSIDEVVACDGATFDAPDGPRPLAVLSGAWVSSTREVVAQGSVFEVYLGLFSSSAADAGAATRMNPFGRIALPLTPLSEAEIAAEILREHLETPAQRERAVIATGPLRMTSVGKVAVYDHFLGADAPGTDTWATPHTLVYFLRLASAWFDACSATTDDARRCTLHVGDLAYVDGRLPDPLGHQDHAPGSCVDLRLFRTDESRYEAYWNRPDDRTGTAAYDRKRTLTFLRFAYAHAPVGDVFFNDPAVRAALPRVRALPGHDDHIHLCLGDEGG